MTVSDVMKNACLGILNAYGKEKDELTNQEARNVQDYINKKCGIMADDRDIKIFYKAFAAEYWKTHDKKPPKRKDFAGCIHAA